MWSFVVISVIVVFLTRLWLVLPTQTHKQKRECCKTLVVLGSGGHTAEMIQLLRGLDPKRYRPRTYVVAHHDILSENKAIQLEQDQFDQGDFYVCHIARARKVGQSWRTVPFSVVYAIGTSIQVLIQAWPDVIICNGPGSCIPLCLLSYIPRIVGLKKIEIIYIESFARVSSLSLTGKLLYPFVDRFLVQWPELSDRFERAEYKGILV